MMLLICHSKIDLNCWLRVYLKYSEVKLITWNEKNLLLERQLYPAKLGID